MNGLSRRYVGSPLPSIVFGPLMAVQPNPWAAYLLAFRTSQGLLFVSMACPICKVQQQLVWFIRLHPCWAPPLTLGLGFVREWAPLGFVANMTYPRSFPETAEGRSVSLPLFACCVTHVSVPCRTLLYLQKPTTDIIILFQLLPW